MSYVTNLILNLPTLEEHEEKLKEVNEFFKKDDKPGFVLMDSTEQNSNWYGGSKCMECWIALGGFNYVDLDGLKLHLKSIKWVDRDDVQLIIKDQNDDRWHIWGLKD